MSKENLDFIVVLVKAYIVGGACAFVLALIVTLVEHFGG